MTPHTPKILLVFCDGTGMDGNISLPDGQCQTAGSGTLPQQSPTNVLFLSRAVKPYSKDNHKRQIVLYLSGVGSEADFNADPNRDLLGSEFMEVFGTTVASKIRDAYAFLAQNYEEGDEICLFGFSRGAYTVRKVASLIDRIGLLQREFLHHFFGIWRDLNQHKTPTIPPDSTKKVGIKCVGVWDTVGAAYDVIDALNMKDNCPLPNVEVALHALALQENRKEFLPTLWDQKKSGSLGPNQIFKQVWFPGAHSDVGGGYERHELSDLALIWMTGEIESFINLDTKFIQQCLQPVPKPWGKSEPHNAFAEIGHSQPPNAYLVKIFKTAAEKFAIGKKTRLDNGNIGMKDIFHQSLKFAPTKFSECSPDSMITLNDLKTQFDNNLKTQFDSEFPAGSWSPKWAPLNDFEKSCREIWGKPPHNGPVTFTTTSTLFNGPKALAKL